MVVLASSYNKRLEKFYLDVICSTMEEHKDCNF